ncbi:MFS transporter [Azomonas agilis]|uniref:MFS transporter n=1 Tax=Azomonas agilis TaxID=116849 RepID=A0A562J188_9GAMM|nr:MFS transporter [Azomonas agilis]
MSQSQFSLLRSRRFLPFFITQMLGAFNDNLYKQALVLAALFKLGTELDSSLLVNLCALLFILPFFLFSALGGLLGERMAKDQLMRLLKLAECLIMLLGAIGILWGHLSLMLVALFLMGTQSALFGPVKYSILPQHLQRQELLGGNALVETGTFLAILGGSLFAGLLVAGEAYAQWVAFFVLLIAVLGYLASRWIPPAPPAVPGLPLHLNLFRETQSVLRLGLSRSPLISRSLLGNSWFWFIGALYLTQIPAYVKEILQGDETLVTLILMLFSVGIALGSLLCERLSGRRLEVEVGLVPLGALGLSVFGLLLWWHSASIVPVSEMRLGLAALTQDFGIIWALLDILGLGIFGGIYIVPLYALIQERTQEQERTRVIAAGNILNAVFMLGSAILAMIVLTGLGLSIPELFFLVALLNALANIYLCCAVPEFSQRIRQWLPN